MKKILITLFTCVLLSNFTFADSQSQKRPNILFVIADDWGKDAKSYGTGDWINMPTFDRIASEGILFHNAFTSNPKCAPCRASITTGRNSWQLKESVQHNNYWPTGFVTYPDILEENGYFVGFTGKGWSPGDWSKVRKTNPAGKEYSKFKKPTLTKLISNCDYSKNFIDDFMKERPKDMPFCFWLGFKEPHRAYEKDSGLKSGKKTNSVTLPKIYPDVALIKNDFLDYAFEAEYLDSEVAKVIKYLEDIGELDNTIVVYTSDHGMPFPRIKGQIYNSGFNVPLAIRWGKIAKPRAENTFVNVRDFAPTFLEAAGVAIDKQMTGKSILPLLKTQSPKEPDADQFHLVGKERHDLGRPDNQGYPVRAIRTNEWLLVKNYHPDRWPAGNPETFFRNCDKSPTKDFMALNYDKYWSMSFGKRPEYALYNIIDDIDCINNLAENPKYEDILESLKVRLIDELKKDGDFRALGKDTSWLDKVEWVGSMKGSWDAFKAAETAQQ